MRRAIYLLSRLGVPCVLCLLVTVHAGEGFMRIEMDTVL
jgi:hypothetical protein